MLLPPTLTQSTATFAGLRSTLDALDPLVEASKPASAAARSSRRMLHKLTNASIPTIAQLNALISNPAGTGDLTSLLQQTPSLGQRGRGGVPAADQAS